VALLYAAFAALWIVTSGTLLAIAVTDPVLLGRIELAKGLLFVAVTGLLLYLLLRVWDATNIEDAERQPIGAWRLLLIFTALALVVPLIGIGISRLYGAQVEREAYANLTAIARLKAEQIENWLGERLGDSEVLASDAQFAQLVGRFAQAKEQQAKLSSLILDRFDYLLTNSHYTKILLLKPSGRLLLSAGEDVTPAPVLPSLLRQALASKKVQRSDIYRDEEGDIHLEWALPLVVSDAQGEHVVAVVVLRVTAQRFLFPLIQTWPTASASGEIMLVRREGDSVIHLNDLRHRQGSALRLRRPLTDADRPAVVAVLSAKPGTALGRDRGDIPVLAAYRPVAGTNWHIVAKVDRDEVLAPLRELALWVSLIALAAIAAVGTAVMLLWRQQQRASQVALRARSMAAIEERERRYRAVAQSANDAIVTADSAGNIVEWNPSAARLFGYTDAEIRGQPLTRLIPERFRDRHREGMARVTAGGESRIIGKTVELAGLRKDGTEFPLELSLAQWQTASGRFFTATLRDITERKQREADLLRFRMAMDATAEAIYLVDRASMRFIDINAAACAMWRLTREELFALGPDGVLSISRAELERAYDAVIAAGAVVEPVELLRQRRDGTPVWVELRRSATPSDEGWTIVSVVRDITERKRSEEALRAAEEQFRGLVEQSLAGIYIIQDGRFVYVNPRFAEMFGYASAGELIGVEALSVVAEPDRGVVAENMRSRIEGDVENLSYGFTGTRKDGSLFDAGVHGARATHDGRPAVIGLMQDISEKKRAEEQIQHYVAQLETAFMSTVEVATTLSELRDPYTAGHERRVGEIAVAIGAELGIDARRQEGLRVAGYLHDIGKITIPAEILSKPGRLTPIEFQLIQGHPQSSYDVLKAVKFPWPVAEVALQHHERIDGSGYPQGLKGEAILLEARIIAVADVVEAMSSHRPYRPGLGIEKALAEIERGRGSAYDTEVTDACLRLFRDRGYQLPA
jgi:PAS domain S-box-containing protein